jgi:hypothetical protein
MNLGRTGSDVSSLSVEFIGENGRGFVYGAT